MELVKWKRDEVNKKKKSKIKNELDFMLRVSPDEAHEIIISLSQQMKHKTPNAGRTEFYTKQGEYFTIAVSDEYDN